MDTQVIFAVVIVLVLSGGGGAWYLRGRSKLSRSANTSESAKNTMSAEEQTAALERIKQTVSDLLQGMSGNLDTIQDDTHRYSRALQEHRESIEQMATVEDLRELEQRLLSQVKDVQGANDRYRRELDVSNATVAAQQQEMEQLQNDVGVDFLTELPNRRQLEERISELGNRAERYDQGFSMVVFDIDHFKRVNDKYGHQAGDRVLRAVAQLIHEHKRASDFLARYGGEEFVLILPQTELESAERLAKRTLEKTASRTFQYQQKRLNITLSAGVGELAVGRESTDELFARVDSALYDAKNTGRNRACVSPTPEPTTSA